MRITTRCQRNQVRSTLFKPGTVVMIFKELKSRRLRWRSSLAFYRSSLTLQLACRNGHLIFRNKIHRGTHRQNPLLAAARESGHIPPSFSNKAINAVPSPVWPRSQQYHYAIPAVSSPLATISATPYPLSRPHWPRSQLGHTRCLVPIGHDLSYAIPAVSSPLATISATPYTLSRPHWPRSQLRHSLTQMSPHWPDTYISDANTPPPASGPIYRYIVLGCGSFVRGRKRKKGDSIPFILSRRDYMSRLPDECP